MGRPELFIRGMSPAAELARRLRDLRATAGNPSYRELANIAKYSYSALAKAAAGDRLPTFDVTMAYVRACYALRGTCDRDLTEWTHHWETAKADQVKWETNSNARPSWELNTAFPLAELEGKVPSVQECCNVETSQMAQPQAGQSALASRSSLIINLLALVASIAMVMMTLLSTTERSSQAVGDGPLPLSVTSDVRCHSYWVSPDNGSDSEFTMQPQAWVVQEFRASAQCLARTKRSGRLEVTIGVQGAIIVVDKSLRLLAPELPEVQHSLPRQLQVDINHGSNNIASRILLVSGDSDVRDDTAVTTVFSGVSLEQGEYYSLRVTNHSDAPVSVDLGRSEGNVSPARIGYTDRQFSPDRSLAASILSS